MKNTTPLGIRIVNAIVASDLLEDEKKLLALEDLNQMYSDKEYFKLTMWSLPNGTGDTIMHHHLTFESKLGSEFWERMNEIIGIV